MTVVRVRFVFILLNLVGIGSVFLLLIYAQALNQHINSNSSTFYADSKSSRYLTNDNHIREGSVEHLENQSNVSLYTEVSKGNEGFQRVDGDIETYVYSAIYDDIETPVIRVITLIEYLPRDQLVFMCIYSEMRENSSDRYYGRLQYVPEPDSWGYSYRSAFIVCEVPLGLKPDGITIKQNGTNKGDNNLRVIYPSKRKWRTTRCFTVLHSNFSGMMQFIQTMEFSLMFGIEHFVVYSYRIHESVLKVMGTYRDLGILEILPWNLPLNRSQIHYFGQLAAIQECIYRNIHVSEYVLTGDTDEIFVPKMYNSTLEMIEDNFKGRSYCASLFVRNSFFPLNLPSYSEVFPHKSEAEKLNLTYLLYTSRIKVDNPAERSKLIVKPDGVEIVDIHDVTQYRRGLGGCVCQSNHCLLHHYRHVSVEDLGSVRVTDTSLHEYSEVIVKRISDMLKHFGL